MDSSDLFTVFSGHTEVYYSNPLLCEYIYIDDPRDIDATPQAQQRPAKSSILKKYGQNKKVHWEENVVDNEHKMTARKQQRHEGYSSRLVALQAAIVEQEALIKRQGEEILRLKGSWAKVTIGEIPEGFENYATGGTEQEINTAIKSKLWELLLDLKPKREKSDKILGNYQRRQKTFERKVRLTAPKSEPSCDSEEIL